MTAMSDMIACGKRGGPNFLETIRPDPLTYSCPRNYVPCSVFTNYNDTICVKEYERDYECPVIDMFIVHEAQAEELRKFQYIVTDIGYPQAGGYATHIAFSKFTFR